MTCFLTCLLAANNYFQIFHCGHMSSQLTILTVNVSHYTAFPVFMTTSAVSWQFPTKLICFKHICHFVNELSLVVCLHSCRVSKKLVTMSVSLNMKLILSHTHVHTHTYTPTLVPLYNPFLTQAKDYCITPCHINQIFVWRFSICVFVMREVK